MNQEQARAVASICVFAAFADGGQSDSEREKVKEVVGGLGLPGATEALRRVMFKETTPDAEAAVLTDEATRVMAWEAALAVCEADGATSAGERAFLDTLAASLKRPLLEAREQVAQADATMRSVATGAAVAIPVAAVAAVALPAAAAAQADPRDAEVDSSILKTAILTAAVELLPQNLATLAIIPLQSRMVVSVGKRYGHELSMASVKELAATVGVGVTGQVLEGYARKLFKSLGKSVLGGIGGTIADWGTGPALTFATTYAMGHVAKTYYSGGRTLSALDLRGIYQRTLDQGKQLYTKYEPNVRETAAKTDPRQLLSSLRQ